MKKLFGQEVMSPQEVATRIGVSLPTLLAWLEQKIIPSFKIGNRKYIKVADVSAMEAKYASQDAGQQ